MPVLSARKLSKAYGAEPLFHDVALTIRRGERVGLLGINGTGKSTLLRILSGIERADIGTIDRRRDATILYLPQEPELDPAKTPREIVMDGLAEWRETVARHKEITHLLEHEVATDARLSEQSALAERVEALGGWSREHLAVDMLSRLGVTAVDQSAGTLSGGERRRVALARVLVAQPTLAILDEPTNHLDTSTIDWLEDYLTNEYTGALLMVTHDRYVLDAICDRILEIDRGTLYETQGGYGDYLEQKAERLAHEERTEQNRLNFLRREKAWLLRAPRARTTKQKARIGRAEAAIANVPVSAPGSVDLVGLEKGAAQLGKSVLDLEHVAITIADRCLVRDLTLALTTGERIGIIGVNGVGKTSLLRVITGELAPSHGKVVLGTRTKVALFDQSRASLRDDWSIIDNIAEREGAERTGAGVVTFGKETMEVRTYLELFLFDGARLRQKVGSLSGGERARVALAMILKGSANLLLLDEPTNDLDVATLSALEELLIAWPGCVLAVSHDRYFLDRVATSILSFEGNGNVVRHAGNYSAYQARRSPSAPLPAQPEVEKRAKPKDRKGLSFAEKRELGEILSTIARAEERVAELERSLANPELYRSSPDEGRRLGAELAAAQSEVARLLTRWEDLETRSAV